MAISPISNQNTSQSTGDKANNLTITAIDKEIQALQEQKEVIHERLEKVKNNERMDVKQKNEMINEYQKQIAEIDAQIRAKEAEKLKPKEVKPQEEKKDEYIKSQDNEDNALLNGTVNLQNLCSQFAGMVKIRSNIDRQIDIVRSEATKHSNVEKKMEEVYKLEDRKKELEKRMAKKIEEIQGEQDKQIERSKVAKNTNDRDLKNDEDSSHNQQGGIKEADDTKDSNNKENAIDILV